VTSTTVILLIEFVIKKLVKSPNQPPDSLI